eukprot:Opistho-1_new@23742
MEDNNGCAAEVASHATATRPRDADNAHGDLEKCTRSQKRTFQWEKTRLGTRATRNAHSALSYRRNAAAPALPHQTGAARLVHRADEVVDLALAVAVVAALNEVVRLLLEAAVRRAELERPEEVGRLLEVGADRVDLVDEVLHADNAVLAEGALNDGVVRDRDALLVHLGKAALVDELLHRLEVGVAVGKVGLGNAEHVDRGLVEADEDAVVDLEEAEELEDLAHLGVHAVDTPYPDNEGELGLGRDVEVAVGLGLAAEADLVLLRLLVLLGPLLGALEDRAALNRALLAEGDRALGTLGLDLLERLALLEKRLRNADDLLRFPGHPCESLSMN